MRRTWGMVVAVLVVAGCGNESAVSGRAVPTPEGSPPPPVSKPVPVPPTPEYTYQWSTRKPAPAKAFEELVGVKRLSEPDAGLGVLAAGQAQVIFSCNYEPGSGQWTNSNENRQNPPGQEAKGPGRGDRLDPATNHHAGKAFGDQSNDPTSAAYLAESFTQDSWPQPHVITAFHVPKTRLGRATVIKARNEYAKGCAFPREAADPRLVSVSVYAPWPVTL